MSILLSSSCCFLISTITQSFFSYLVLRVLMACDLGAIIPVTFSIMGDLATYRRRGFFSSGLDLVMILGSGSGILLGAIFGWKIAFGIVGLVVICVNIPLLLLNLPPRGFSEPEFEDLLSWGKTDEFSYRLDLNEHM